MMVRIGRLYAATAAVALAALASSGGCDRCGPEPQIRGSVSLAWSLTDPDKEPIACDRVAATTVSLVARNRASGDTVAAAFPCTASPGVQLLAPGVYDTAIALRAADGAILATVADQLGVAVVAEQTTPLAPVTFIVRASLVLSLVASPATTNCGSSAQGGAGITGTTLVVAFTRGGCAPVTFVRKRGDAVVETYVVNCSSPRIASCIERDETLTAPNVAPSGYEISVRGKLGALDCWAVDDTVSVGLGAPVARTLTLAPRRIAGCPPVPLAPALPHTRDTP
jgi:hypothetical protein